VYTIRTVSNFFKNSQRYPQLKVEKFETVLMGYSGAGGETDSWKKPEAKNLVTLSLLRYCPARWIRPKLGSFDRSLLNWQMEKIFNHKSFNYDWTPFGSRVIIDTFLPSSSL
jgi:hypothetical protein